MSLILYREYIFGGKLFLFEDFGSDSVRVSLPTYLYFFDWFRSGMPWWSDKMGIGTSVLSHSEVIFDPFTYILFLFGRNSIIYMFIYQVILKIILSGIFFWLFIGKYSNYKISPFAKIIGAITYAFSGYMIVTGQNYVFATIYVYLPLLLLGFEKWLQDGKKWLLIFMLSATALYFYYFFYMTGIFFAIYAIFRYFFIFQFRIRHFLQYISTLFFYGLLSLGLTAFYWLPSLTLTLHNLRVSLSHPSLIKMFLPGFVIQHGLPNTITILGRLLGDDLFGKPSNYMGYQFDYFQLASYCGVLTLLLVPQIFCERNKRKKILYVTFSLVLLTLLFVPFFSYLFNGFSDFTYRWTYVISFSFALFLTISCNMVFNKKLFSIKILFMTLLVVLVIAVTSYFYILFGKNEEVLARVVKLFFIDALFVTIYITLFIIFFRTKFTIFVKVIIIFLIYIDILWSSDYFINTRLVTSPDPIKYKLGYFDETNSAIAYLSRIDTNIYRVDKSYESVMSEYGKTPSDNDALVQGYRGLQSYNANNQPNYIRFLEDANIFVKYPNFVPPKGYNPHQITGAELNYINGVGDRYLLQTFLGVKYYLVNSHEVVPKLPDYYKYITSIDGIIVYKNVNALPLGFTMDSFITHDTFIVLPTERKDLALLSFGVTDDPNKVSRILKKVTAQELQSITSQTDINKLINERRKNSFTIISYKDDNIIGKIQLKKPEILILTIPYDVGWNITLDGHKSKAFKIDNGLMGIMLSPGMHIVGLNYFPPNMILGIIIGIISLLLMSILYKYKWYIFNRLYTTDNRLHVEQENYIQDKCEKSTKNLVNLTVMFNKISQLFSKFFRIKLISSYFYIITLVGIVIFFLSGLITRGNSFYNFFNPDKKDYFMDFYNPLSALFNGPYTHQYIYPPLPFLFYKLLLRLVPYNIVKLGSFAIRATQSGELVFLFYMLLSLFFFLVLIVEIKKGIKIEKYLFAFIMLFSAPFLFVFERGNIIFLTLLVLLIFVFYKDSKRSIAREIAIISLSIATATKLYPAIFGLLLLKQKRFKEAFRVVIYATVLFILPFFAVGGISQLPLFYRNLLSTSSLVAGWGVGYSVNIQNLTRIIFAFFGEYGNDPVVLSKFVVAIILIFGIIAAYYTATNWKSIAILTLLMILVPAISYEYVLIYMIIPLILFLDTDKKGSKVDYVYLACFILMFIPFVLGRVNIINREYGHVILPLTYGVVIQNFVLFIMVVILITQGLQEHSARLFLSYVKLYLRLFIIKIYGIKQKGFIGYSWVTIKILLTIIIITVLFGDVTFSLVYNRFFVPNFVAVNPIQQGYPYISHVEPSYVHYGDKVVIRGGNFNWRLNKHDFFMSNYGEISPDYWNNNEVIFTVPLKWRLGRASFWVESPQIKRGGHFMASNIAIITVLDRLGPFNNEDIKYFSQIKYLDSQTQKINSFKNYKLRNIKYSRWIPTKFFQVFSDTVEIINNLTGKGL